MSGPASPQKPTVSHVMGVYSRGDLAFERGEGVRLYTANGEAYLDCLAGIAINGLGHAHPRLVQALKDQAKKLWHVSNIFRIPEPGGPGRPAVRGHLRRPGVLHQFRDGGGGVRAEDRRANTTGRTGAPERIDDHRLRGRLPRPQLCGGLSPAGNPAYLEGFGPRAARLPSTCRSATWRRWRRRVGTTTAAVIIEPVQGEGGARALSGERPHAPAPAVRRAGRAADL